MSGPGVRRELVPHGDVLGNTLANAAAASAGEVPVLDVGYVAAPQRAARIAEKRALLASANPPSN